MRQGGMAAYVAPHAGTVGERASSIFQSIFFLLANTSDRKILTKKNLRKRFNDNGSTTLFQSFSFCLQTLHNKKILCTECVRMTPSTLNPPGHSCVLVYYCSTYYFAGGEGIAVIPIIKLFARGERNSGGHVLQRETMTRSRRRGCCPPPRQT